MAEKFLSRLDTVAFPVARPEGLAEFVERDPSLVSPSLRCCAYPREERRVDVPVAVREDERILAGSVLAGGPDRKPRRRIWVPHVSRLHVGLRLVAGASGCRF